MGELISLSEAAWQARDNAIANTKVGAAVQSAAGYIYAGCNVEHRFRCHDIHAEVNALSAMVAAGDSKAVAILITADRDSFTPCGSCLDWIFELGGPACMVAFENRSGLKMYRADELMPHYPG